MNEDSLSAHPHNSGSCAFMLHIVCLVEATEVRGVVPSLVFSSDSYSIIRMLFSGTVSVAVWWLSMC